MGRGGACGSGGGGLASCGGCWIRLLMVGPCRRVLALLGAAIRLLPVT
jgi:hypothetical protein